MCGITWIPIKVSRSQYIHMLSNSSLWTYVGYRRHMYQKYPVILEGIVVSIWWKFTFEIVLLAFYRSCTLVGISGVKEKDLEMWQYDKEHGNTKKDNNS